MNINGTFNSVVKTPNDLRGFVLRTKQTLEEATNFWQLEEAVNSLIPEPDKEFFMRIRDPSQEGYPNDEYYYEARITVALIVKSKTGVKLLFMRTADIALSKEFHVKNLGTVDALVASRVFIPGGNYGILGKVAALRGKTKEYYDSSISIKIFTETMAYEDEPCFMIRGELIVEDDLLHKIVQDPNVIACTSKV